MRTPTLNNDPLVEQQQAICYGKSLFLVVGDVNGRYFALMQDTAQLLAEVFAQGSIQGAQGFIQHQQAGVGSQGTRQCNSLLFAAGELGHLALGKTRHTDGFQRAFNPGVDFINRQILHLKPESNIFGNIAMWEQGIILEHEPKTALMRGNPRQGGVLPVNIAAFRFFQPGDNAQQGALPASGRSQQAHGFIFIHTEGDPLKQRLTFVGLVDTDHREH
ncbi:MAG: hypothetical protein BWX85_00617 [Chloroflexi bacterium ADurb.Bin120]|nr:MAG: hypothetical protein BWX85_00617 [Chloroflexi bacterium ADurb.Bin120]